jgi:5-methyltetrahydropteroyltriglutamate--homocysteine methyltransferase
MTQILTTHAGSLPRTPELTELLARRFAGEAIDESELTARANAATIEVVARQHALGLDVINNGEVGRESFFTYVQHRMTGFSGQSNRPPMRDLVKYEHFLGYLQRTAFRADAVSLGVPPAATGAVTYRDETAVREECQQLADALQAAGHSADAAFVTAPSPGIVAAAMENRHYPSLDAYLEALSTALAIEYRAIIEQGFTLQIDAPDLAMERHTYFADRPLAEFIAFIEQVGAHINRALTDVPKDRVRLHVCWGNYEGPHDEDVPLESIWPALQTINVGAVLLSMANPRHEHEYKVLANAGWPDDLTLVAGVIDTTTNYIEHPDAVADRLIRAAEAIGAPDRLLAGTDCGFETAAGFSSVVDDIAWQKLAAMVEGAARASRVLFG